MAAEAQAESPIPCPEWLVELDNTVKRVISNISVPAQLTNGQLGAFKLLAAGMHALRVEPDRLNDFELEWTRENERPKLVFKSRARDDLRLAVTKRDDGFTLSVESENGDDHFSGGARIRFTEERVRSTGERSEGDMCIRISWHLGGRDIPTPITLSTSAYKTARKDISNKIRQAAQAHPSPSLVRSIYIS